MKRIQEEEAEGISSMVGPEERQDVGQGLDLGAGLGERLERLVSGGEARD